MKRRESRFAIGASAVMAALVIALSVPATSLQADDDTGHAVTRLNQMATAKDDRSSSTKLEWRLRQLVVEPEATHAGYAGELGTDMTRDGIRVIVQHDRRGIDEIRSLLATLGGSLELETTDSLQCIVPVEGLNVIAELDNVEVVRLPFHPTLEEVTEGLEPINADEWHTSGYSGAGVKIGILDLGFYDYVSLVGTDLKAPNDTWWAPSIGNAGSEPHGTACAEVIYDIAPNASYYFANFSTDAEWDNAVAWLISEGVDIISCSVGWYIVGPRDGSGEIVDVIDTAKDDGIFWAQSAGNYAERHWAGIWQNADESQGDYRLDFSGDPPANCNTIVAEAGDTVWVRVGWDDPWGSSSNDYDLTVLDPDNDGDIFWDSWTVQGPAFPYPYEAVQFTAPISGTYYIYVDEYSSTREPYFELFCSHAPFYGNVAGSISDNAASASACSVGAVAWDDLSTLQTYSAQGPTVDSRTKPDLVAPDTVTTDTYGATAFAGTSASAPHVAGAAALVLEAYPAYSEDDIQTYLETNAVDIGDTGMDTLFGWGRLLLPGAPATTDFGDAPDPTYPTLLASDGARHEVSDGFHLGADVDMEGNALANPLATGDDNIDGNDDEDGVVFTSALTPGSTASLTVTASQAGKLDGWVDFNMDGDWDDTGEKLWSTSLDLLAGANSLSFSVPSDASTTSVTFARFRLSSTGGLTPTGSAPDGEVEDYRVAVGEYDWGDTPDTYDYPTVATDDGARHFISGPFMGVTIDSEFDGQPSSDATGDDGDGNDDDDGVSFTSDVVVGLEATLNISVGGSPGLLDAWIDFNGDGDWKDSGEQVFSSEPLSVGPNPLSFNVPSNATDGTTFARFRISTLGGLTTSGEAENGEVEDYQVTVLPAPDYDFGDAPDPDYPTLLANDGARHIIDSEWYLGAAIDEEDDGQPDSHAVGDDTDVGGDDDDGVSFTANYEAGQTMTLDVTASREGFLDAWVDFNDDGDWDDTAEQVFASQALSQGGNSLSFPVPGDASMEDSTFTRFRFSDTGGLSYTGLADVGEVEDYELSAHRLIEGDANLDGTTNIIDAMFVAQYTVGLRTLDANQLICADTTDDGATNIVDAMHISQYTVDPNGSAGVLFKPLWEAATDPITYPSV